MIEVEIDKSVYLPCYQHLLEENDIDIELLYGGRDSGKSRHIAQQLVEEAMALDYFRCILVKQTHESIKDAQWQMIKEVTESRDWQVDQLFNFQTSPLGIRAVNGSSFLSRGMDKPSKTRSLTNPSHAWIEEATQISEVAFITLLTGLRNDYGRVKIFMSFNPEAEGVADYQEFWLFKWFFKDHWAKGEMSFVDEKTFKVIIEGEEKEVSLRFRATHTTYHDNPFVSPQRIALHESLSISNPYYQKVFTEGLWGNQQNDAPWAFAFDRRKHVGKTQLNLSELTYAVFDFNRNPMVCSIIQHYNRHIQVLETIKIPKSGVDNMCAYILAHYPGCVWIVSGDYSGKVASTLFQEQVTNYSVIQKLMNLSDNQIQVKPNPRLQANQTLVNLILAKYRVTIDGEKAKPLIFDMENVKKRADGTIVKDDRDDPAQQSDALDTFRYFCNNFLSWFNGMN